MAIYRHVRTGDTVEAVQVQVTKFVTTPDGAVLAHAKTLKRAADWVVTILHGRRCGDVYVCEHDTFASKYRKDEPPGNR